jgi:hypothetical protein
MWRHLVLVRIHVSEEHIAPSFRVERISDLLITLLIIVLSQCVCVLVTVKVVSSLLILSTVKMEGIRSSETLVREILRHIPEDGILHSHRCENLISYVLETGFCFHSGYSVNSHCWTVLCWH